MLEVLEPYLAITLKLVTGMIGILVFLRIAGKAQMAQITPLDTVSAFVIGALVGGVLYNPDMSMWHILFALAVWTGFNMLVRFCMRSARLRHLIKGTSSYLLRQKGIFSMFDVDDVLFETNGAVTVLSTNRTPQSHLLINNGEIVDSTLIQCDKTKNWVLRNLKKNGFERPSELFCMEWTPRRGFYFVTFSGDVRRGKEEVSAEEIENENQA